MHATVADTLGYSVSVSVVKEHLHIEPGSTPSPVHCVYVCLAFALGPSFVHLQQAQLGVTSLPSAAAGGTAGYSRGMCHMHTCSVYLLTLMP